MSDKHNIASLYKTNFLQDAVSNWQGNSICVLSNCSSQRYNACGWINDKHTNLLMLKRYNVSLII